MPKNELEPIKIGTKQLLKEIEELKLAVQEINEALGWIHEMSKKVLSK